MNDPRFCVMKSTHWVAYVMDDQRYLGRLVVVLDVGRRVGYLRDVPFYAMVDFHMVTAVLEKALMQAFGATMFNWCCLMNNAYQQPDPQPHVHWHFRPRYERPVEFEGETFEDPNFAHHYLREDDNRRFVDEAMKLKIADAIRTAIGRVNKEFLP